MERSEVNAKLRRDNLDSAGGMRCMCSSVSHMVGVHAELDVWMTFDIEAGPIAVSH